MDNLLTRLGSLVFVDRKWLVFGWLGTLCLLLGGCGGQPSPAAPSPSYTLLAPISPPATLTATAVVTRTPTMTWTATASRSPTSIPIPTNTPTLLVFTPYPTADLTFAQLQQRFDFLAETPDCRLPCWLGLTPGVSPSEDVSRFLADLDVDVRRAAPGRNAIYVEFQEPMPALTVYWKDGFVTLITMELLEIPEYFEITRIADTLGTPNNIRFLISQGERYEVVLHYTERKTLIAIYGNMRTHKADDGSWVLEVCIHDQTNQVAKVWLYSDASEGQATYEYYRDPALNWVDWPAIIKETTGQEITTEELFQRLLNPQECILHPYSGR
jgi:hypothetical protein